MSTSGYRIEYSPEETRNHIDIMRVKMGVQNIEFQPFPTRGLYAKLTANPDRCTVRTRCDYSITPSVLVNHQWEIEQLLFTSKVMTEHPAVIIVDVGANIGLFSRQVLGWLNNARHLFAYEPEPENFACLLHNLSCFGHFTAENVGLAEQDGSMTLHMDLRNCGNNSLVSDDLAGAWNKSAIEVAIKGIARESRRWLAPGLPIFYKSDTQGYDELLATLLPDDVCTAMIGGIIELEQIEKPAFSVERFRRFLDRFPNKVVLQSNADQIPVTTEQTMALINVEAESGTNIGFWR